MSTGGGRERLLAEVTRSFGGASDARLVEVLQALAGHLHGFASEVDLTRDEWRAAIDFLTRTGQACGPTRQEFVLLSDVLGLSSLVEMDDVDSATEGTVLGPFYAPDSPFRDLGASILEGEQAGEPLLVRGRVTDPGGGPLAGAVLDVWQNAANRLYAVQDRGQHPHNLRGRFRAGEDGAFTFRTIRPVPYPIPDDGPVGRLLRAAGRHPWRAAHIHVIASAPNHRTVTTHVFDAESDYLDSDAVFGVRESLIVPMRKEAGILTAGFDLVLAPAG
ncbi:MAG TPA: dioxygenase [Candidatus Dormibacteraeota bacterium]|jgi:catechol 1,2-dioxygenase|nr:dioxygenase [Candidatus Dormibacteraeota bacterium]